MKTWIKTLIGSVAGIGAIGAGVGIGVGVVLPKTLSLKEGVEHFVLAGGGSSNSLKDKETINYVALGDSVAAGYNGLLGGDYLSYADFTAQSLVNHGVDVNYHNFAQSGDLIADTKKKVIQNPATVEHMKEADLVTLSIGGNDLLRYLEFFGLPFSEMQSSFTSGAAGMVGGDSTPDLGLITPDKYYDRDVTVDPDDYDIDVEKIVARGELFGGESRLNKTPESLLEDYENMLESYSSIITGESTNADMFGMNELFVEKLLDLVRQEYMGILYTINKVAKNAKIIVVTPPNPFIQFGDETLNQYNKQLGMSLIDYWDAIMKKIENATLYGYDGKRIGFTEYVRTGTNEKFVANIDNTARTQADYNLEYVSDNAMPNITDIHPSTFGHELIGEQLFNVIAKDNGLTVKEELIQRAPKFTDDDTTQPFERLDEASMSPITSIMMSIFRGLGELHYGEEVLTNSYKTYLENNTDNDYPAEFSREIFEKMYKEDGIFIHQIPGQLVTHYDFIENFKESGNVENDLNSIYLKIQNLLVMTIGMNNFYSQMPQS